MPGNAWGTLDAAPPSDYGSHMRLSNLCKALVLGALLEPLDHQIALALAEINRAILARTHAQEVFEVIEKLSGSGFQTDLPRDLDRLLERLELSKDMEIDSLAQSLLGGAMPGVTISTDGGAYIDGALKTNEFIGRDKVTYIYGGAPNEPITSDLGKVLKPLLVRFFTIVDIDALAI
jgi:hypothetical protein